MGNDGVTLDTVRDTLRARPFEVRRAVTTTSVTPAVHVLRGRFVVAGMRGMLIELSRRCGQAGGMDALDFYLNTPAALKKIPYLALVGLREGVEADQATADDVQGAVLLHEYMAWGWGTKVFATDDTTGRRTVIAPAEIRTRVAEIACRTLLKRGALAILVSLEGDIEVARRPTVSLENVPVCWMTTRTRSVPLYLPLEKTLEATLASLGRHTRRNLRYYRRRLEANLGAVYVPCVSMSRKAFLAANHGSINPVTDELAGWRYDSMNQLPGAIFAGVQGADGQWLSLIGGRRRHGTTEIIWQMNQAGLARYSLSTVMRSYLLEHEIALGTLKLEFDGGTPHSIRHWFFIESAVDMIVRRRSLRGWLLRRFAAQLFPEKNFVGQALLDRDLRWTRW